MTAPARWVFPIPKAVHLGPVENRLDASADAASGLRPRAPQRLDRPHNEGRVNLLDGCFADDGGDIGGESIAPLLAVLAVMPPGLVRCDEPLSALVEGDAVRFLAPG